MAARESRAASTIDPHRDPLPILTAGDADHVPALVPERSGAWTPALRLPSRRGGADGARLATMSRIGLSVQACGDAHLMNFDAFSSQG